MTACASDPMGDSEVLEYKGHTVRVVRFADVPFFALPDLCDALGWNRETAKAIEKPQFPVGHTRVCDELPDQEIPGEMEKVVMLSPVAVWWWTTFTNPQRGQSIAAWTKREASRLCPNADLKNPFLYLTLDEQGALPPRPWRYSGRLAEWEELRYSDEYINRPFEWRSFRAA